MEARTDSPIEHLWPPEQEELRRNLLATLDHCQTLAYEALLAIGLDEALDVQIYFEPGLEPPYVRLCRARGYTGSWPTSMAMHSRFHIDGILYYLRPTLPLRGRARREAERSARLYQKWIVEDWHLIDPVARHSLALEVGL